MTVQYPPQFLARFWAAVDKNGPIHPVVGQCWVWTGYSVRYGRIKLGEKNVLAHIASYRIHHGTSSGYRVLHKCDIPICVNPEHLFLGTQADNVRDRNSKGRQAKHERVGSAKLTKRKVLLARRLFVWGHPRLGYRGLGVRFGVCREAMKRAILEVTWKGI